MRFIVLRLMRMLIACFVRGSGASGTGHNLPGAADLIDDASDRAALLGAEIALVARHTAILLAVSLVLAGAVLLTLMGVSAAVVLVNWDGSYRIMTMWLVVGFWAAVSVGCAGGVGICVRRLRDPVPVSRQFARADWSRLKRMFAEAER